MNTWGGGDRGDLRCSAGPYPYMESIGPASLRLGQLLATCCAEARAYPDGPARMSFDRMRPAIPCKRASPERTQVQKRLALRKRASITGNSEGLKPTDQKKASVVRRKSIFRQQPLSCCLKQRVLSIASDRRAWRRHNRDQTSRVWFTCAPLLPLSGQQARMGGVCGPPSPRT